MLRLHCESITHDVDVGALPGSGWGGPVDRAMRPIQTTSGWRTAVRRFGPESIPARMVEAPGKAAGGGLSGLSWGGKSATQNATRCWRRFAWARPGVEAWGRINTVLQKPARVRNNPGNSFL